MLRYFRKVMRIKNLIGMVLVGAFLIGLAIAVLWVVGKLRETADSNNTQVPQTPSKPENQSNIDPTNFANLALGNPSNATADLTNVNNYLMINNSFALSWNREKLIPNWVSWKLTAKDMGGSGRSNDFRPDERMPQGWTQVTPNDYRGEFDRGHTCPSGDRTSTPQMNSTTFLMTNMTPQTHDLNTGPWEKFESYTRGLAFHKKDLYIVAGTYGEDGRMNRKITIPTNDWKIVVVVPRGKGISSIDANTRVIAVNMPNIDGIGEDDWHKYLTTVRQIEQKTGLDFLSNLPKNIQDVLETKIGNQIETTGY